MIKKLFKAVAHTANIAAVVALAAFTGHTFTAPAQADTIVTFSEDEMLCLQQNIYFEARNQSTIGKVAVAWVTFNRMTSSAYPDTICGVVKQGLQNADGSMMRHKCQFSWYCDGKSDRVPDNIVEQRAWADAGLVAEVTAIDFAMGRINASPVEDAVMYHADYVDPFWASSYDRVVAIDTHIFYN